VGRGEGALSSGSGREKIRKEKNNKPNDRSKTGQIQSLPSGPKGSPKENVGAVIAEVGQVLKNKRDTIARSWGKGQQKKKFKTPLEPRKVGRRPAGRKESQTKERKSCKGPSRQKAQTTPARGVGCGPQGR